MIELAFLAAEFQCYAGAPMAEFRVEIQDKSDNFLGDMTLGQTLMIDHKEDFYVDIKTVANAACFDLKAIKILRYDEPVPQLQGAFAQTNLDQLYNLHVTDKYYQVILIEGGSSDPNSPYYDLQDLVIKVDLDPNNVLRNQPYNNPNFNQTTGD